MWQQDVGLSEAYCLGRPDLDSFGLGLLCLVHGNREDTVLIGGLHPVRVDIGRQPDGSAEFALAALYKVVVALFFPLPFLLARYGEKKRKLSFPFSAT